MNLTVPFHSDAPEAVGPSIIHEARSSRDYVDLHFPFTARIGNIDYEGITFSRNSLIVQPAATVKPLGELPAILRLRLSGFVLELEFVVVCANVTEGRARFQIARIDPSNQAVLARLIRMLMIGIIPNVDDLALPEDEETPLFASTGNDGPRWPLAAAAFLCIVILLAGSYFGGQALYYRLMTVQSEQAVLVAPQISLTSTISGKVAQIAVERDGQVDRDDLIVALTNADIEAELAAAEARLDYFNARLADEHPSTASAEIVDYAVSEPQHDERTLRRERDYATALFQASRLRATALRIYAPCDCISIWSLEPGMMVVPGDRLMTLLRREHNLTVEVKVPLAEAFKLEPGLRATLAYPGITERFGATLTEVRLVSPDSKEEYRSAARFATLVLTPDVPADPSRLGESLRAVVYR
jgi:hypothetical protein